MTILKAKFWKLILWLRQGTYEKRTLVLVLVACIFLYVYYTLITENGTDDEKRDISELTISYMPSQRYLVNTSTCKIPDVDPFNEEVNKYVRKEEYSNCSKLPLLTYIDKSNGLATLKINTSLLPLYSSFKVTCCYSKIYRINYFNKSDNEIRYSPCTEIHEETTLTYPFVKVECSTFYKTVYSNCHATVIPSRTRKYIKEDRQSRYSVLLVGIDSISKLNLRRTMPKTYSYLKENFHNLKGYNKVEDNTFPNLMAILTGQSRAQLRKSCGDNVKINNCDIIWDKFRMLGYITAYAEDQINIGTFNYDRPGFRDPPTTYYYRPYLVAAEKLGKTYRKGMTYCAGPETSGERVLDIAKDFSVSFKDVPSFGLFWMNSFSHDDINLPSVMDERVLGFLNDTKFKDSLRDTIMIFFSDHGFRFGDIRYTHTGWLEERLPFIYFYIPDSFKDRFKDKYDSFKVNTGRLTTPYDLYLTLEDVLEMGNKTYKGKNSTGCPNCRSLFTEMEANRTCKEAAIDQHWCTCTGHDYINPKHRSVREVAQYVVEEINSFVKGFKEGAACAKYSVRNVVSAGMSKSYLNEMNETVRYFLVILETTPNAMFEATVEAHVLMHNNSFKLLGDISRINRYKDNSYCVKKGALKKYCYCEGYFSVIENVVCNVISC
ncbi:hypothetical protein NQ315_003026 [Exocentrus adspersus]|uniref:DUF229 domain containing protein n=1 Tax=Exocentrus adspersus TaxID=1586481 RepID=A0AAV8W4Q0_9CUCU|nr:hypothetical protein NQ315_003026 [Exocentrus adspersus]